MPLTDQSIMTFGLHKGKALANVPDSYLIYIFDRDIAKGELRAYIEDSIPMLKLQKEKRERL